MTGNWARDWQEIVAGPEHLRGVERIPDYPDDQDFSEAYLDPDLEAVGRLVNSCTVLENAIYQVRARLDPVLSYAEVEWQEGLRGSIAWLRETAQRFTERQHRELTDMLDRAEEYLDLRNGVVHGRHGRGAFSEVHTSHRWVKGATRKDPPIRVKVEYTRNSLVLTSVRAGNLASDLLRGLDAWSQELRMLRQQHRLSLGPGHPMRIEGEHSGSPVLHALSLDRPSTALCGADTSEMGNFVIPHSATGEPTAEMMFEDSNASIQCKKCFAASGLASF